MAALFFAVPAFVAAFIDPHQRFRPWFETIGAGSLFDAGRVAARALIPLLLVFTAVIAAVLWRDPTFDNRRLWNWNACRRDLPRVLGLFTLGAGLMLAAAWALDAFTPVMAFTRPDGQQASAFLRLPREAPWILLLIAIGYPWLSAYPQEILHRAYFFHRYAPLFRRPAPLFALNVIAFAWLHIPFWSLEAILLTLPGGALFAWTYLRTRSALAAGIEHALYGWWAFFTGLGWFVFTGSIGR
jgi:membrane protease YdiL (CAAX protease family)